MIGSAITFGMVNAVFYLGSDRTTTPITSAPLWLGVLVIALSGMVILPLVPVGFSFLTEATYPVSEVMTLGTTNFFGQLYGIVLVIIIEHLCTVKVTGEADKILPGATVILSIVMVIGAVISLFTK